MKWKRISEFEIHDSEASSLWTIRYAKIPLRKKLKKQNAVFKKTLSGKRLEHFSLRAAPSQPSSVREDVGTRLERSSSIDCGRDDRQREAVPTTTPKAGIEIDACHAMTEATPGCRTRCACGGLVLSCVEARCLQAKFRFATCFKL